MPQPVLALPAPGTKTETVNKKTQLATKANNKQLTGSASFSGSKTRLGVSNESTYQTPSVGDRGIDQMLRDHNKEIRKHKDNPGRLWGIRIKLHQNLEDREQERSNALSEARSASEKAKSNPATTKRQQAELDEKVRRASKKYLQTVSGVEKAQSLVGKRGREGPSGSATPQLKRTKSTENPLVTKNANASRRGTNQNQPKIFPQIFQVKTEVNYLREKADLEKKIKLMGERLERQAALIEEFQKTQRSNSNSETVPIIKINTAEINRLKRELNALKETHISPGKVEKMKKKLNAYEKRIKELTKSIPKVSRSIQVTTNSRSRVNTGVQATNNSVKTPVITITNEHIRKIVKQETNAGVPTTPPGITKTNIERLLQPFKQPVTVKFAPTISVKGGSAKATGGSLEQVQIQHKTKPKTPANKKKKPLKLTRGPATARKQESAKFRNAIISKLRSPVAAKRREALYSLRTPTTGQRKKHVIELIDRVLRRMKVRADVEKKLIKFYESLSERHIKQLFGGRTKEGVKTILKKQVSYFSKKR